MCVTADVSRRKRDYKHAMVLRNEEGEMVTFSNTVLSHRRSKTMRATEKRSLAVLN
jgi:hypothetical protein